MKEKRIEQAYRASKQIYDDVLTQAHLWARLYNAFFWGGVDDNEVAEKVLGGIPAGFAGRLLDVPVGTAVFTWRTYKSLPRAEVICVDASRDMLSQAEARFSGNGMTNVTCLQGDVGELPFEAESFDVVLSMNGFHAFPDKERAFSEVARVLKKGGIFCGCFYIRGACRRTDFLVKHILAPKGWFTPPFQTRAEVEQRLKRDYAEIELEQERAILSFRCVK